MNKTFVESVYGAITFEDLSTRIAEIKKTYPEASRFCIESSIEEEFGEVTSKIELSYKRNENEEEIEYRLNEEDRNNKKAVFDFKEQERYLKEKGLI